MLSPRATAQFARRLQFLQIQSRYGASQHISLASTANPLPASFLRGGTSKGIFIRRDLLPDNEADWAPIFLGLMGSPDPEHGRQLDGMGGGVSSLSKIVVVGPVPAPNSARDAFGEDEDRDMDVTYTFCQVGIRDARLDYSGNCGNLSSVVGVFAVDEGLCSPRINDGLPSSTLVEEDPAKRKLVTGTVRSWNTNTRKRIDTTFPLAFTPASESSAGGATALQPTACLYLPQARISGVPGRASRIELDFVKPAGAGTKPGVLLPTGHAVDELAFAFSGAGGARTAAVAAHRIRASLVDATNPTVFIASSDLSRILRSSNNAESESPIAYGTPEVDACVEQIRQAGARAMGFQDPMPEAQPKIAVLSAPLEQDAEVGETDAPHIVAHAYSMRVLHRAIPMTVGLCLGVAARTPGTLAWDIVQHSHSRSFSGHHDSGLLRIRHPSGDVEVGAEFGEDGQLRSAKVVRTGKRLMKGVVWW